MNKNKLKKLIKYFILCFLVIYISFNIIIISLFNIGKKYINRESVTQIIDKIDINNFIKNKIYNEIEYIDIKNELLDCGISEESFYNLINSEELNDYIVSIISNSFDEYLSQKQVNIYFDKSRLEDIVKHNISELDINNKVIDEDVKERINNKIEEKIPTIVDKANNLIDKYIEKIFSSDKFNRYIKYFYKFFNIFDIIYSKVVEVILYIILLSFILMTSYVNNYSYKSLKYIGVSFLISFIIFFILSLVLTNINISYCIIKNILNESIKYSVKFLVFSLILITLNIIIHFRRKEVGKNGKVKEKIKKKN